MNLNIINLLTVLLLLSISDDCCRIDLTPFDIDKKVYLNQNREFMKKDLQEPEVHFFDDLGYEIYELEEVISIFGEERMVKKSFAFFDNRLHYVEIKFPIKIQQFQEVITFLKTRSGYDFINMKNKFFFNRESDNCAIILKINSEKFGHSFLLRVYRK